MALGAAVRPTASRPGPGRPTRREAQQRGRELLEQTLDLFVERGYDSVSMIEIAAAVGMAKRTIYARYKDKMTLFKAAVAYALERWAVPFEELQRAESDDLEETLFQVARIQVACITGPLGMKLIRLTNAESYRHPELGLLTIDRGMRPFRTFLANLLYRRLGPAIAAEDLDDIANTFLNVTGVPARLASMGLPMDDAEIEGWLRKRVHWFLNGIVPAEMRGRV